MKKWWEELNLPMWHYPGLGGEPAWFSEMHRDIAFERYDRAVKENELRGYHMRYCASCEVGIGIMEFNMYYHLYVKNFVTCPICNKAVCQRPPAK